MPAIPLPKRVSEFRQSLLVALAGWLETFAAVPARAWLVDALECELDEGSLVGATLYALDETAVTP